MYQEAISSLMYAALGTCLDIMLAILYLYQFMQNPGRSYLAGVTRVVYYLKGTKDHIVKNGGLWEWGLQGYCNAEWALQAQ